MLLKDTFNEGSIWDRGDSNPRECGKVQVRTPRLLLTSGMATARPVSSFMAAAAGGAPPAPAPLTVSKTDMALANLRARALDLHARLLELRDSISMLRDGVGPARNAPWAAFLAKYETLAKLFSQLTEELDRAVVEVGFQNYILQPRAVAEDPDLIPNMLRTKLEPEVERDVMDLQAEYARDAGGDAAAESGPAAEAAAEALEMRVSMFNAFVSGAVERFDDARDRILNEPRPVEAELPRITPAAHALLQSLNSGAALP